MARTVQQIQNQITAAYVAAMNAIGIVINPTQWSRRNKQQLTINTIASATAITEQNFDAFVADTEALIAVASPQTAPWLQNLCLNVFQFDASVPQIPQLDITNGTFAPYYPVVNPAMRIITQCAIVPGAFGTTTVKAAKTGSSGTTPLSTVPVAGSGSASEFSALQSFLNLLTVPGISLHAFTGDADKIYVQGLVTYQGGYSAVIQSTVVAAINEFFLSIPASGIVGVGSPVGIMKLTDLIAAVRAVPGVTDFELVNVNARPDGTPLPTISGAYNMVNGIIGSATAYPISASWSQSAWNSGAAGAGYMQGETTTGYTLNDSLIYNAI